MTWYAVKCANGECFFQTARRSFAEKLRADLDDVNPSLGPPASCGPHRVIELPEVIDHEV